MKCPSCNTSNPDDYKFCQQCGANLPQVSACPACGQGNPSGHKFCKKCGAALIPAGITASENQAAPVTPIPVPTPTQTPAPAPVPPPTGQIPQVPPQPAAPPVVIIRDGNKKRTGLSSLGWALLGVVLVITVYIGLLWFDVLDVPIGAISRLPAPIANVVGQVAHSIEKREVSLP
ncbi:zinc ribbon domain-containing protein, partial [Chloroflexota bacterium]